MSADKHTLVRETYGATLTVPAGASIHVDLDPEFRPIEFVETILHNPVRDRWDAGCDEGGVRLYCTASPEVHGDEDARWALQVRARVKTRKGPGTHFAVGTASMSREDLLWLRGRIDAALKGDL
jgi:hypothetical protein